MEVNVSTRSLTETDALKAILARLERLSPNSKPLWGAFDAPHMVCHLGDSLRIALGELPAAPKHTWFSRTLGKFVVVHTGFEAPRGKVQTAPEMLTSNPSSWQTDVETCKQLAVRVGSGAASAEHPAFGRLTPEEWGKMSWKHMDHHLRQFGV
jgi:hypothetical protein